jgi:hypothetical protein
MPGWRWNYSATDVYLNRNTTAAGAGAVTFAFSSRNLDYHQPADFSPLKQLTAVCGDFNTDGRPDLAVTKDFGQIPAGNLPPISLIASTAYQNTTTPTGPLFTTAGSFPIVKPLLHEVADLNQDGRPDVIGIDSGANTLSVWTNTTADPLLASGAPVAAQFGAAAVGTLDRGANSWRDTAAPTVPATALAISANGSVVAAFGGYGVWRYSPGSGWSVINGYPATAVAIDALGNITASFPGFGTATYRPADGSWTVTTLAVTDTLAGNANGELVGDFPGFGVYRYHPALGWSGTPLTAVNTKLLAVAANGDVVASFANYGTYAYRSSNQSWEMLNGYAATAVTVDPVGVVTAGFVGFGTARYLPWLHWWLPITPGTAPTQLAADWFGHVFATFAGSGVWEYHPAYGWQLRNGYDATWLGVG